MAVRITWEQMSAPVVSDRARLHSDLLRHLREARPVVFSAYPLPYISWLVGDTIDLAAPFELRDVIAMRTFMLLRFDVAPGFFKHPDIARVLSDRSMPPMERWERLTEPDAAGWWIAAQRFDGAQEWRGAFWGASA